MRSSLILGSALVLALAVTNVVQARKELCKDGSIGGEVVVKAAKVQKPLYYASPDAINRAAAAREGIGRLSANTGGCGGTFSTTSSTSSSSSSNSLSSSFSSLDILGEQNRKASANAYIPFGTSGKLTSDCGCNKKSGSLQLYDLLSSGAPGQVVPSFPPIGDLCYPSSGSSGVKSQVFTITKVTPAYPGKLRLPFITPKSQEVCVNMVDGQVDQVGLQKLGLSTSSDSSLARLGWYGKSRLGSVSTSNDVDSVFDQSWDKLGGSINSGNFGALSSSSSHTSGYAGSQTVSSAGSLGLTSSQTSGLSGYENSLGTTGSELYQGWAGSFGCNDFGDEQELPKDYSYSGLPADPVSLTLAYKNLFPLVTTYNKRTKFVPEDKLAFGHRTVPTESAPSKQTPDVPEEKLQILDKPVVELKPLTVNPVTVGVYSEYEEAKLAELEAIERERIRQEELSQLSNINYITYGDLGYEPINKISSGKLASTLTTLEDESTHVGCGPVGPAVSDFVPGSVVVNREFVQTEDEFDDAQNIEEKHAQRLLVTEASEEDDDDDPSSGIFAKLKSMSRKGAGCTSF